MKKKYDKLTLQMLVTFLIVCIGLSVIGLYNGIILSVPLLVVISVVCWIVSWSMFMYYFEKLIILRGGL